MAHVPNGARAERRECQLALTALQRESANVARAAFAFAAGAVAAYAVAHLAHLGTCAVWRLRFLARALFGRCALRQVRSGRCALHMYYAKGLTTGTFATWKCSTLRVATVRPRSRAVAA